MRMFPFFSGWKRLSVQTVAADQRLVLRSTSDKGSPMHWGCFDCGGCISEIQFGLSIKCDVRKLGFFVFFFFFVEFFCHRWRCVTDTVNRLG